MRLLTELEPNLLTRLPQMNTQNPDSGGPDPWSCVSDVLLKLSLTSTRFLLELQTMESLARQRRVAGGTAADAGVAKEEIERSIAEHVDEIRALCSLVSLNPREGIICSRA